VGEREAIIQAIVALNFNEPDKALDILLEALSDSNFEAAKKGIHYGIRPAAA
jgi:hypothetical protein